MAGEILRNLFDFEIAAGGISKRGGKVANYSRFKFYYLRIDIVLSVGDLPIAFGSYLQVTHQ